MKHFAIFALLTMASPLAAEQLTINQVVTLNTAGIGDEAIIAKIKGSGSRFDLSTDQMLDLKKQGVSSAVLAAMVNSGSVGGTTMQPGSADPAAPHPKGLYLLQNRDGIATMAKLEVASAAQMKMGGFIGSALTYGIAPVKSKVVIPGVSANLRATEHAAIFYLFLGESNPDNTFSSAMYTDPMLMASSPAQFILVRLEKKGGGRETTISRANIGGVKTGTMEKDRLEVKSEEVRHGVYRLTPSTPLPSGEYAFLYSVGGTQYAGAAASKIFDFSVL